jgi:DNA-binding transcriptional MocR family regulator
MVLARQSMSAQPRYVALAAAVEYAIASGLLEVGTKLPAERELTAIFGLSRTTVGRAYADLEAAGWLDRQVGSGTFARRPRPRAGRIWLRDVLDGVAALQPDRPDAINLTSSRPFVPADELREALDASAEVVGSLAQAWQYAPQGLPHLRAMIAEHYAGRGLPTTPEQILVTTGAQQALDLVFALHVEAGDPVVVESPTYHGVLDMLRVHEARPVSLGTAPESPAERLRDLLVHVRPSIAYLMTSCNAVTGRVMSTKDQEDVAQLSLREHFPVVEDDIFAGLTFASAAALPPPMAAHAPGAPIFTVGSTSKLIWNGLRVGWLRAPASAMSQLARLKGASDLGTSMVAQLVAGQLLAHAPELAARRRDESAAAFRFAGGLLRAALPSWRWDEPEGARGMWIELPGDSPPAEAFVATARRHGVSLLAGPTFSSDGAHAHRFRLMPVHPEERIEEAVRRLTAAWREHVAAD